MITGLRPILSDSQPNRMKNGVPIASARRDQQLRRRGVDLQRSASGRTARRTARSTTPPPGPAVAPNSASSTMSPVLREEAFGERRLASACLRPSSAGTAATRCSCRRIHTEIASSTDRHAGTECASPTLRTLRCPSHARHARITSSDRNRPSVAVVWMKLVHTAALPCRRVLGDVSRRAAVFTAERQALQQPQGDERHRCQQADARVARQHADEERRQAHDHDRDEERVLAPDEIAEAPEHQRAERAAPRNRRRTRAAQR